MENKRVLITGATGLIGKEALKPLSDLGFEIFAISTKKQKSNNINWICCNIFDEEELKKVFATIKPTHLLNFAWTTTEDYLTSDINYKFLEAGKNMLKFFAQNGGKRAVYAGTCFEYNFKDTPLKETDEINPTTIYAKCKNDLRIFCERYSKENNINFGWGRIFYVFGHHENPKRLTTFIINSLKNNKKVFIKTPNAIRDYAYSKDIAGAFAAFLSSDISGIVNISTGKGISIKNYAQSFAIKIGKEKLIEFANDKYTEPSTIIGDNTRLTKEIGYKFQHSFDEAIESILKD